VENLNWTLIIVAMIGFFGTMLTAVAMVGIAKLNSVHSIVNSQKTAMELVIKTQTDRILELEKNKSVMESDSAAKEVAHQIRQEAREKESKS